MAKHKHLVAVTAAAKQAGQIALPGLTGHALTALQHDAARVVAKLSEGSSDSSLQFVSCTNRPFQLLYRQGNKTVQIDGDNVAVSAHD